MKVIRTTWETNSSSSHSIAYSNECFNDLVVVDSTITVGTDEYGWVGDPCVTASEKLEYAVVMLLMTEYPDFEYWDENFKVEQAVLESLDGYKLLLEAINVETACNKIIIKRDDYCCFPYGYIDHQSCDYESLASFFHCNDTDAHNFLFGKCEVLIDNDNH